MTKNILLFISLFAIVFSNAQTTKTAIVEHFTNTRCGICANKNPAFYTILNSYPEVLHIAYHPSSPYASCIFSQHNPMENDERAEFYNLYGGTPRLALNGDALPIQTPLIMEEQLDATITEMSDYSISVIQSVDNNQVHVLVRIEKLLENSDSNLNLYVGLAENEINYEAPNGEDVHHQVFRLKLGEEEITAMAVNEISEFNFTYHFHDDWQAEEMFAFAILQNDSKIVLQSGKSQLIGDQTGTEEQIVSQVNLRPNPSQGSLFIINSSKQVFREVNIYNIYGQLVFNQKFSEIINVEPLIPGIYILQMKNLRGEKISLKFQKE